MRRIVLTESQIKYIIGESVDELVAYHGSGADFDKFNHKKYMGSGCGSQSFGWGSYVTDDVAIGKTYAEGSGGDVDIEFDGNDIKDETAFENSFRSNTPLKNGQELYNLYKIFSSNGFDIDKVIKQYKSSAEYGKKFLLDIDEERRKIQMENWITYNENIVKILTNLLSSGHLKFNKKDRYLYEVEIPDDNGSNYIDWYGNFPPKFMKRVLLGFKRLNPKQLKWIADKNYQFKSGLYQYLPHPNFDRLIDYLCKEEDYHTIFQSGLTTKEMVGNGKTVYWFLTKCLGSPKAASLFLLQCGFTGIKYETGTKWKKPDGASSDGHNYVIFNANDIKILKKENVYK